MGEAPAKRSKLIRLAVIALLFAGAASATVWCAGRYASDRASARALATASACAAGQADRSDCALNLSATLDRVWNQPSGRYSTDYYITVSGPEPANGDIQLVRSAADGLAVNPGGQVDVLVWRGQAVRILGALTEDFDTVDAPDRVAGRALNWLVAAALWCLACAATPLALYTQISRSPGRYVAALPVVAAVMFTVGAGFGATPATPPAVGLSIGAVGTAVAAAACVLGFWQTYRQGRL